jgi:hypothetical protein
MELSLRLFHEARAEFKRFQHLQPKRVVEIEELTDRVANQSDSSMAIVVKKLMTIKNNMEGLVMHCV